jgi:hypothetical protein
MTELLGAAKNGAISGGRGRPKGARRRSRRCVGASWARTRYDTLQSVSIFFLSCRPVWLGVMIPFCAPTVDGYGRTENLATEAKDVR